jgi:hypothetical protein
MAEGIGGIYGNRKKVKAYFKKYGVEERHQEFGL